MVFTLLKIIFHLQSSFFENAAFYKKGNGFRKEMSHAWITKSDKLGMEL